MNLDEIWKTHTAGTQLDGSRPDFRFDAEFYARLYPDAAAAGLSPDDHFEAHGRHEGRFATAYRQMRASVADLDERLLLLVRDPDLRDRMTGADAAPACELFFELLMLGDPVDRRLSYFSEAYYMTRYRDLEEAGVHPLSHFLMHGLQEGRRSLRDLEENLTVGHRRFDRDRPTVMVCVHEMSKTGAPIVGLEIAAEAARTHNVVVAALRGGPLLEEFRAHAVEVAISDQPGRDFDFMEIAAKPYLDRAILNSVEAHPFIPALLKARVPFATYIHEYADYTLPRFKCIFSALFADLMVFSSRSVMDNWGDIFATLGFDAGRDATIIPQRELRFGQVPADRLAEARKELSRLIGTDCTARRVVLGAGHAQWRKGTDLFVQSAQVAARTDPDAVFVWIGDGLNHEDPHFGVWIDKQIRETGANRPGGNLFFLPAGGYYDDLCRAADVFFLSSRLDPLPNVVFDAAKHGCQIVMFRNASGFDDPVYTRDDRFRVVDFADVGLACDAILAAPAKRADEGDAPVAEAAGPTGPALFDKLSAALDLRLQGQARFVAGGGAFDVPVAFGPGPGDADARRIERGKIWTYGRRFVWRSLAEAQQALASSDNWVHAATRIERFAWSGAPSPQAYSVHFHSHYAEDLAGDLTRYRALAGAQRIVVTTDTDTKRARIEETAADAGIPVEVLVVPNTGRDILPFLRLFADGHASEDETWCHLHQKRSVGTAGDGPGWKRFLMSILLGHEARISSALERIADPLVGLVAPFDPYRVGWGASRRYLNAFGDRLDGPLPGDPIVFPVGNMFWARGAVAGRMYEMFGDRYPWPNEPLPSDGTVYHFIERLWPAAAAMCNLEAVFLCKEDEPRG